MEEAFFDRKILLKGKEFFLTKEEWENCMRLSTPHHFIDGKPSIQLINWIIFIYNKKYKAEISLSTVHTIVARLVGMEKQVMYKEVSQHTADRSNPRRKRPIEELMRDSEISHEYQDAIARGCNEPFEEFAKSYKKDHLLRRPPNSDPKTVGIRQNGATRYYKTLPDELEAYYRKKYIRSVILVPSATLGANLAIGTSKLGGQADLPPDVDYPIGNDGHPMRLLCQINTTELSERLLYHMPQHGILSFFCSVNCYELFSGAQNMATIFTPADQALERKPFKHADTEPYTENALSFRLGKTIQLPPWEFGNLMQERLNRDPTLLHHVVDESFDNAQPSFRGYGKLTHMSYMQLGERKLGPAALKGYAPLIYLPSYMDVEKTISIGDGGAAAFLMKFNDIDAGNYSQIAYSYFANYTSPNSTT